MVTAAREPAQVNVEEMKRYVLDRPVRRSRRRSPLVRCQIRERGKEYGVTTGRPRRIGWFDAVAGRYAVEVNGADRIFLTKPDVLDDLATVKICTAYELDGRQITHFPSAIEQLERCKPVYEEWPGFGPIAGLRRFADLTPPAQNYVRRLEELLGAPISMIGTGQAREDTIDRELLAA
jgi:adenylosuccinate synthase